jgi:hypothetical protein
LRIEPFQGVAGEKNKKIAPPARLAQQVVDQRLKQPRLLTFPPIYRRAGTRFRQWELNIEDF